MSDNIVRLLRSSRPEDRGIGALADLAADEIDRLRDALREIKEKGYTTGYDRTALSQIAARALKPRE